MPIPLLVVCRRKLRLPTGTGALMLLLVVLRPVTQALSTCYGVTLLDNPVSN